jgi:hypothetical protein
MTIKCTMLIQQRTAASTPNAPTARIGGWSESWYYPGTSVPTASLAFGNPANGINLSASRAAMLPIGAAVIGQRYQIVQPSVGPTQITNNNYPGSNGLPADIPQMALLCRVPGVGSPNVRRMVLRGIPDINVIEGELSLTVSLQTGFGFFVTALGGFQFRGRDLTQPQTKIISITSLGLVTCELAITVAPLQMVRILRTLNPAGTKIGGRFQVATIGPQSNQFTLTNWTAGGTVGGAVRPDSIIFPNVDITSISISRIITRRVGRPFISFRGRRSARIR